MLYFVMSPPSYWDTILHHQHRRFHAGQQSDNAEQQRAKRNRNVLKMAIPVVVGYVLCWVLCSLVLLALELDRTLSCGFYLYHDIGFFTAVLSFAINPCICFTFSGNDRQGLKRLLACFNPVQE